MQVVFNRTIDISMQGNEDCYVRVSTGTVDGIESGMAWLSMPLDTAIELYEKLGESIEDGKTKLNAQIKLQK